MELLSPTLCPPSDGRGEDLSVCPGAVAVKGTGAWEVSLLLPPGAVFGHGEWGALAVLNHGGVFCPREGEWPCWPPAPARANGAAGGWDGDLGGGCHRSLAPGRRHLQSATCKGFQHVKVDTLSQPEAISSVAVPGGRPVTPRGGGSGPPGSLCWGAGVGRRQGVWGHSLGWAGRDGEDRGDAGDPLVLFTCSCLVHPEPRVTTVTGGGLPAPIVAAGWL